MENTERPFKAGIYTVVDRNGIEEATADGGELVRILMAPAASAPQYLIRNDRDKKLALEEARKEAEHLKNELGDATREYHRAMVKARKNAEAQDEAESKLRGELEAAHILIREHNDRELELRERLLAYEEALNLYRAEVGRARRKEIESEAIDAAALVMEPMKGRDSQSVFDIVLRRIHAQGVSQTYVLKNKGTISHISQPLGDYLRGVFLEAREELQW
ncbi:MAG: hypothetical protein ACTSX8_05495 [Alphaproteobacteria bacterium]